MLLLFYNITQKNVYILLNHTKKIFLCSYFPFHTLYNIAEQIKGKELQYEN